MHHTPHVCDGCKLRRRARALKRSCMYAPVQAAPVAVDTYARAHCGTDVVEPALSRDHVAIRVYGLYPYMLRRIRERLQTMHAQHAPCARTPFHAAAVGTDARAPRDHETARPYVWYTAYIYAYTYLRMQRSNARTHLLACTMHAQFHAARKLCARR